MIVRRLATALKRQDWMTVCIEFTLVVAGVLVALQVDNFNKERLDRTLEQRALERLLNEAQNAVAYSEVIVHHARRLQEGREAALAKLQGQEPVIGDPTAGLATMSMIRDMTPIRTAYNELSASGDLTLIKSTEVQSALSQFNGVVIFHDRARREYLQRIPDIMALATDHVRVRYDPDADLGLTVDVNWQLAGEDTALMNAINRVMADQIIFNQRRIFILEDAQILCDALAKALKDTCTPPDWLAQVIAEEKAAKADDQQ